MKVRDLPPVHSDPLVSISCIAYNQECYIEKCIEGFLNQNVDFPIEILIHDDASTDRTPAIIEGYRIKFPHLIKPILQKENQYSKGVKCIHSVYNFTRARGEYIATCEGDDYWIDEQKICKQLKVFKDPTVTMCGHDIYVGFWNYKRNVVSAIKILSRNIAYDGLNGLHSLIKRMVLEPSNFWISKRIPPCKKDRLKLEDIYEMYKYGTIKIPSVSIFARGEILRRMPTEIYFSPTGHREHIFWAAMFGDVVMLRDKMGQKINQINSMTKTKIIKKARDYRKTTIETYLNRFLILDIPEDSKVLIEDFIHSGRV